MSSINKTELGFNQWALSDKPTMEDFNADNALTNSTFTEVNNRFVEVENTLKNKINSSTTISLSNQLSGNAAFDNENINLTVNLKQVQLSNTANYNDITVIGLYSVHPVAENAPNSIHNTLLVTQSANNPSYVQQLVISQNGNMYLRVKNGEDWTKWRILSIT